MIPKPMTFTQLINLSKEKFSDRNRSSIILFIIAIAYDLDPSFVLITDADIQRLSQEGIIYKDSKGKLKINEDLLSENDVKSIAPKKGEEDHLFDLVSYRLHEYRNKWKGLFVGSMGTATAVRDKLIRWLKENPDYTFDDVLKATDYWIHYKGKEIDDPNFLGQADYFIFKHLKDGTEISRLSSVIEESLDFKVDEFNEII